MVSNVIGMGTGSKNEVIIYDENDWRLSSTVAQTWRVVPTAVVDSGGEAATILAAMQAYSNPGFLKISPATTRTITFDIPTMKQDGILVFEIDSDTDITWTIGYSESFNNGETYSPEVAPTLLQVNSDTGFRLQKKTIPAGRARKVRISFAHNKTASGTSDTGFRYVASLGLFQYMENNQHDYIVKVGASISQYVVRNYDWNTWWKKEFGRDPVVFNESVNGYAIGDLYDNISTIIARHPRAKYFLIEIGGNDVTSRRPYTGATYAVLDSLRTKLISVINTIKAAGITPILSRIPYRNYSAAPAVNNLVNESNGAKPFNENLIDPIIRDYTPIAWDGEKGSIDPYTFMRNNVHYIDATLDSGLIHPFFYGGRRLSEYWALAYGGLIYNGVPMIPPNESTTRGQPGAKEKAYISAGADPTINNIYCTYITGWTDEPTNITWNQFVGTDLAAGDIPCLINTDGYRCGIGLDVTAVFGGANQSGEVATTDSPYPETAKLAAAFIASGSVASVKFTGLSDSATYKLTLFGSRSGSGTRLTRYTVGASTTTLNALGNTANTATLTALAPSSGSLTLDVSADSVSGASFGYLNAMTIERE